MQVTWVPPLPGSEWWDPRLLAVQILVVLIGTLLLAERMRRRSEQRVCRFARFLVVAAFLLT